MTKVFITRKIPEIGVKLLLDKGYEVKISDLDRALTKEELKNILTSEKYDAVITLLNDKIDEEILSASETVKIISNYAVGFNNIDIEYAKKKKISVGCCHGTSAQAVAQHAVSLTLCVMSRIVEGQKLIENNTWKGWDPDLLMGTDLFGKTVGLIGTGNIGQVAAEVFYKGFNCKIIYTDMVENKYLENNCAATKVTQEELLKNADVVSLHVPLMKETTHLINSETLKMMKLGAILINTSRGPVVDELALVEALKNKTIYGAGLDVFEFEPNVTKELFSLPNVVLTPHIASAKTSAREEMSVLACKNVIAVLEGGLPISSAY